MSKNLPKVYKESVFSKLIQKIKQLFFERKYKNASIQPKIENINTNIEKTKTQNTLIDSLKIDIDSNTNNFENQDNESEKQKFMKNLTDNPEVLESFSIERLEKILQWYREDNERKSTYLKRLER